MTRAITFAALLILPFLALACSSDDDADDGRLRVVATTTQIGDFAANVGGDRINLTTLLTPNQDAHDFEPAPSQARSLAGAGLILQNGLGLDAFVEKAVEGSKATIVDLSEGLTLLEGHDDHGDEEHDEEEEDADHEEHEHDPHVWLSVTNARKMVENIRDALVTADSANADFYRANATTYLATLDTLDAGIRSQVATIPSACRKLITNHDVLGYYADAYGFTVIGSVIPATTSQAQASASDVANIVRLIRAEGVPAIFAETSVNPALMNQVGREANVKVVDDLYGDSLGPANSDGATYKSMMESNTRKIVDALKTCTA